MLKTAIPQVKEYRLLRHPVFHVPRMQKVIDSTLPERARADRQKVLELLSSGIPLRLRSRNAIQKRHLKAGVEKTLKEQLINLK